MEIPVAAALGALAQVPGMIQQGVLARRQEREADRLANTPRPQFQIPQAYLLAGRTYRGLVNQQGLPGQQIMEEQIGARAATAQRNIQATASDPTMAAALAAQVGVGQMEQINQLNLAGAEVDIQDQLRLAQYQQGLAEYEERQFEINKFIPYMQAMAASSALRGAAIQNRAGIMSTLGTTLGATGASLTDYYSTIGGLMGNPPRPSATPAVQQTNPRSATSAATRQQRQINIYDIPTQVPTYG